MSAHVSWQGFGFGLWRNSFYPETVIWTLAIGPLTIHVWRDARSKEASDSLPRLQG